MNCLPEDSQPWMLTLQQPHGWLIQRGISSHAIISQATDYRGPVLLHVALQIDEVAIRAGTPGNATSFPSPSKYVTSAVFGLANVVDCIPGQEDNYTLTLADFVPCVPFKWANERLGLSELTFRRQEILYPSFRQRRLAFLQDTRIRQRLEGLGLSYKHLCISTGLTPRLISSALREGNGTEGQEAIARMAAVLGVTPHWVLTGEGDIAPADPAVSRAIAKRIDRCLNYANRSNAEIAALLGESVRTVRRLRTRIFDFDDEHVEKLAAICNVPTEWLKTGLDPATGITVSAVTACRSLVKRQSSWDRLIAKAKASRPIAVESDIPEKDDDPQEPAAARKKTALKSTREDLGLKLKEVAAAVGVSALTLATWEGNPSRVPVESMRKWKEFLRQAGLAHQQAPHSAS